MGMLLSSSNAWAVNVSVDTTISADTTNQQTIDTDNVTLTNDANINFTGNQAVQANNRTGVTITNNAGASINALGAGNGRGINAFAATNLTITNSGTISANDANGIRVSNDANLTITNNAGGLITAARFTITLTGAGGTLTNSGTISATSTSTADPTISSTTSTGLAITNNAGGVISAAGTGTVIVLSDNDTIVNSGSILNNNSVSNNAIQLTGNNNTITLKEGSLLVGTIQLDTGTIGSTLKIDQGFGQSYFYSTSGTGALTLEDLSGNTVLQGSAGSVGLGAQESVDELLGLRTYNLRSALKRYAASPKSDQLWMEPYSYFSKRGTNSSVIGYETYGYGMNFIYPLKSKPLDFIFTIEHSQQNIDRNQDVSRTSFLGGFNAPGFASFGNWNTNAFAVAGMGWNDGQRDIFTNTTTGKDNITSHYKSYEAIVGWNLSNVTESDRFKTSNWKTDIGFTFGVSRIPEYNERNYFAFQERNLLQGSIHGSEQFTTKVNHKLSLTLGVEIEHRTVLAGREQRYSVNGTFADYKDGSFFENSLATNIGMDYTMKNNAIAYVRLDNRLSNLTRGTYGGSLGIRVAF